MSCVPNGSRTVGQAGEEPAPARGAAWPGAVGEMGRSGRRARVAGPRQRPFQRGLARLTKRPRMACEMERAVECGSLLCSALPEQSREGAARFRLPGATSLRPQGTAGASPRGLQGPRQAGRGGMGSAGWLRPPSVVEGALEFTGPVRFVPTAGRLPSRSPRVKMLHLKEVHYVCVAHLRLHSL